MTDRTQLRLTLLDTGRQMLHERPATPALDHIKIAEVARRAGVTTGAIYHYWESQDQYRADLLEYVLSPERYTTPERTAQLLAAHLGSDQEGRPSLRDLLREIAIVDFHEISQSADFRIQLALWISGETNALEKLREQYRGVDERLIQLYESLLEQYDLEPRPPFSLGMIATIVTALLEGLVLRQHADPAAVRDDLPGTFPSGDKATRVVSDGSSDEWNLFGLTLAALVPAVTRPRG